MYAKNCKNTYEIGKGIRENCRLFNLRHAAQSDGVLTSHDNEKTSLSQAMNHEYEQSNDQQRSCSTQSKTQMETWTIKSICIRTIYSLYFIASLNLINDIY